MGPEELENHSQPNTWRKYFRINLTMALVSAGYFSNGNLMVWISKLFFFNCHVSIPCNNIDFRFIYF